MKLRVRKILLADKHLNKCWDPLKPGHGKPKKPGTWRPSKAK